MRFVALGVNEGDSFLIQHEKTILIDGGIDDKVVGLVKKYLDVDSPSIDLVICTHYDKDHINGIIEILKSDIHVKELWLPSREQYYILKEYLNKLEDALKTYNEYTRESHRAHCKKENCGIKDLRRKKWACTYSPKNERKSHIRKPSCFERLTLDTVINYSKCQFTTQSIAFNHKTAVNYYLDSLRQICSVRDGCHKIHETIDNNVQGKPKILLRYFEFAGNLSVQTIFDDNSFEMVGLNCIEVVPKRGVINRHILKLTTINKESLVFMFNAFEDCKILFTADSGFLKINEQVKKLMTNVKIVTAPHHGSNDQAHKKIYKLYDGKTVVFVRSDNHNKNRPCDEYIRLENKHCTICNTDSKGSSANDVVICIDKIIAGEYPESGCRCVIQ